MFFSLGARSQPPQLRQPYLSLGIVEVTNTSDQRLMNRLDANEAQNIALQRLDAVSTKIPAIDEGGHPQGHHDSGRAACESLFAEGGWP